MALTDNLVSYWKFDESSGNAVDATGNGRTLTNANTTPFVAGKINNAADFESGTGHKFTRTDISGTTAGGSMSISGWVKVEDAPSSALYTMASIASGATSPYIAYIVGYEDAAGTKRLFINRQKMAVANSVSTYNTTLTPGTFYHLVYTYDGTTAKLYLDGNTTPVISEAKSGDGSAHGGADETSIGEYHADQGNNWDGLIDEVGVWSRALTATEVSELYNSGAGFAYPFATPSSGFSPTLTLLGVG